MFDRIKELVEKLEREPIKNYRVAKDVRSLLQLIKVEAQNLRQEVTKKVKEKTYDK